MNDKQKQWIGYALLVLAILVAGYLGVSYPLPEMPMEERMQVVEAHLGIGDVIGAQAVGPTRFRSIQVDHDANMDGTITGALTGNVTGNITGNVTGNITGDVTGDLTGVVDVTTFLELSPGAVEVVSAGSVIVPVSAMQPITSAAAVTCSTTSCITTTGFTAGDVLVLRNDNASDVITIDGTGGTVECKADVALGAADILGLIFDGTDWNCLFNYDNS